MVLVLGIWSRSFAFGLGLTPLVWPLVVTRVEYLLNVVDISGYSRTSEIASKFEFMRRSAKDKAREDLVVRFLSEATRKR